ncbi:MAG: hypothetical protein QGH94_11395 [Phycisphaerae bacterium]|jgi:hypothetical protein|nr:hypothetical protein [Phycisphaerae bacterium]MDP7288587.1 hypothetical protein [Phycisphaerae bacterium]
MNSLAYILAADDFNWVHIVALLLFVGITAISSFFQKWAEKKKQQEAAKPKTAKLPTVVGRAQPPAPPQQPQKAVRVAQELKLRQQRQAQLEADRQKRLSARKPPEADTKAIEARLVDAKLSSKETSIQKIDRPGVIIELQNRSAAKKAMILHEIFASPKALRKDDEM